MPSDIETSDWSELAANNIQPAPAGWPSQSSPMIVYSNGRENMGAIKRDWNRRNPTVTSGGSANVQTLTFTQGPVAYVMGQCYTFVAGFTNTGACTLNVNSLGAKSITQNGAALGAGSILAGAVTQAMYDGTNFQLTASAVLPLSGGTLTGALTLSSAAAGTTFTMNKATGAFQNTITGQTAGVVRWQIIPGNSTTEGGSNAGSDFQINRAADGGSLIDTPLSITRSTGNVTIFNQILLDNTVASGKRSIFGNTSGSNRWQITLGNATAESGSNVGSDFTIARYTDAGAGNGFPISIARSTGVTTFSTNIVQSDRSLKENVEELKDPLDRVMALHGISFTVIGDERHKRQIGLIAQDVEEIVPEVVESYSHGEETKLGVDYGRLVALLIEGMKQLTAKVAALEARLPPETLTHSKGDLQ